MADVFHKFRYHIAQPKNGPEPGAAAVSYRGESGLSDEAVARRFLNDVFSHDSRSVMRGIVAPERSSVVPDLKLTSSHTLKTGGRILRFEQTRQDRPIFGSAATVEILSDQTPVAANGAVAHVEDVSPIANLSERQALARIAEATGKTEAGLLHFVKEAPHLYYFRRDAGDVWHLAYLFKGVPAVSGPHTRDAAALDPSPRDASPLANYLVDAHDGSILFCYGAAPTAGAGGTPGILKPPPMPIPVSLKGLDESGVLQAFIGNQAGPPPMWELFDVDRSIKTYDLQFQDLTTAPLPVECVRCDKPLFDRHSAAVSAHVNAFRVYKFFKGEMNRDGINNKGMDLISIVNCTYGAAAPVWQNAMWWDDKMWYGQRYGEDQKTLHSFSEFLDVIAHELTHGVTATTCDLVYQGQSGALNESISDIFGIIIRNWYELEAVKARRDDVGNWNWRLGEGLGKDGGPLRDMSNPALTGDPDHMRAFVETFEDYGGVHANSNIHNKAAYNFLTARTGEGKQIFLPEEVAQIYYLALLHLTPMARFSDILGTIADVAGTFYPDPDERALKTTAIRKAYADTGIVE